VGNNEGYFSVAVEEWKSQVSPKHISEPIRKKVAGPEFVSTSFLLTAPLTHWLCGWIVNAPVGAGPYSPSRFVQGEFKFLPCLVVASEYDFLHLVCSHSNARTCLVGGE